ncbi:MAG: hypothetical protein K9W43_14100 [Candidatus Thorarchaeota archaeon]|nr:hypothetical protein [Candidatus Thorarchaeota archaeon]
MTIDDSKKTIEIAESFITALEQNPRLRDRLVQIIAPADYVKRDELAELLKEIREIRVESMQRFEASERRFEAMQKQIDEHLQESREHFEASERRFEAMQKQIDENMRKSDERFEAMQKQIDEHMHESRERFEAMQKQIDENMRKSDERFEAMQKQIDENMHESRERFEAMQKQIDENMRKSDERFEAMQKQIDKRFEAVDKRFEELHRDIVILQVSMSELSGKYGKRAEDALRKVLAEILKAEGIDPDKINHVQVIDPDGKIFAKGYTTDIDIYYEGKQRWIIEYKARAERNDIMHLVFVGRLMEEVYKLKPDRLLMVALNVSGMAESFAEEMGVDIIHGIQSNPPLKPPP